MCGIVGAVAQRDVVPILIEGLRRLEYRGYDSAGVAVLNGTGTIKRLRTVGKVRKLQDAIDADPTHGPPAIAHTPLLNTYDTQSLYRVTCTVEPVGIYDPDALFLTWRSDLRPDEAQTQRLAQVSGNLFEAFIAPQPARTRLRRPVLRVRMTEELNAACAPAPSRSAPPANACAAARIDATAMP